jgi:hypothetical protein
VTRMQSGRMDCCISCRKWTRNSGIWEFFRQLWCWTQMSRLIKSGLSKIKGRALCLAYRRLIRVSYCVLCVGYQWFDRPLVLWTSVQDSHNYRYSQGSEDGWMGNR